MATCQRGSCCFLHLRGASLIIYRELEYYRSMKERGLMSQKRLKLATMTIPHTYRMAIREQLMKGCIEK